MNNNEFTKSEIKTIEKFLNFAKQYYEDEAMRYADNQKLLEAMVNSSVQMEAMIIAINVCKENHNEDNKVKINVL